MSGYAGIILAGGNGTRLSSLTRTLAGDDRPKQFCRLIGDATLLEQTRRRARLLIAPERFLTVVTRQHERFYVPALAGAARAVYGRLPSTDLSRHVFQASGESLAVLPVSGVGWNDLGDPARVQATRERIGWELVRA